MKVGWTAFKTEPVICISLLRNITENLLRVKLCIVDTETKIDGLTDDDDDDDANNGDDDSNGESDDNEDGGDVDDDGGDDDICVAGDSNDDNGDGDNGGFFCGKK